MTDDEMQFKHAHITGQAMLDHWGPIVDRIAAETADWRDEWIYDLITENGRLREALEKIARLRTDLRGDFSLGSHQSDIARAALGDTK